MLAELQAWRPHVVLVFRPEIVPAGLFANLRAATLGFLTEPLPRAHGLRHPDLTARLRALKAVDPANFDRVVAFDPNIATAASKAVCRLALAAAAGRRPLLRRPGADRRAARGRCSSDARPSIASAC